MVRTVWAPAAASLTFAMLSTVLPPLSQRSGEKLRQGEWDEVAEECRGVYEDLTKGIQDREAFKQTVESGLKESNHISDTGLAAFQSLIKDLGTFSHEFHHYRDSQGNVTEAVAHKEDAYALYITLVGIVSLLVRKHVKLTRS